MCVGKDNLFVAVGAVVSTHGIRGKIKVKMFSGDTEGLSSAGSVAFREKDLCSRFPYAQRAQGYLTRPPKTDLGVMLGFSELNLNQFSVQPSEGITMRYIRGIVVNYFRELVRVH